MTAEDFDAIRRFWCMPPEEFAATRPWPLRDAREDIRRLLDEIVRLQVHETELTAGLARMTALYRAEAESHAMTMDGLLAW